MLKHTVRLSKIWGVSQPPLGGCVLKPKCYYKVEYVENQPPLGGCVLKLGSNGKTGTAARPAAFRRLCVET